MLPSVEAELASASDTAFALAQEMHLLSSTDVGEAAKQIGAHVVMMRAVAAAGQKSVLEGLFGKLVNESIPQFRDAVRRELAARGMEPVEKRSDSRSVFIAATPAQVFAAMSDPERVARWWGPDGFTSTIHQFDFRPGGTWLLTLHGPDGKDYPNESRFTRLSPGEIFEIDHVSGHHFVLTIELQPSDHGTQVHWRQTFDTVEHYEEIAQFVTVANEQNLQRLTTEVLRSPNAA